jgi:peptidoglycan/LPS O-acetylase OafA/YrhL
VLSDPTEYAKNITMTHLRIDALVAGVLISYFFHFHRLILERMIKKWRPLLIVSVLVLLSWTPYLDPQTSIFVRTFGFTMVYLSFAIILSLIVTHHDVFEKVQNTILSIPYKWCCQIGVGSYAIYVIHSLVNHSYHAMLAKNFWELHPFTDFFLTTCCSVMIGFLIKHQIENRFLKIRDRLFPSNG